MKNYYNPLTGEIILTDYIQSTLDKIETYEAAAHEEISKAVNLDHFCELAEFHSIQSSINHQVEAAKNIYLEAVEATEILAIDKIEAYKSEVHEEMAKGVNLIQYCALTEFNDLQTRFDHQAAAANSIYLEAMEAAELHNRFNIEDLISPHRKLIDALIDPLGLFKELIDESDDDKDLASLRQLTLWLMKNGWFYDWDPIFLNLCNGLKLEEKNLNVIFDHFNNKVDNITENACAISPHREQILKGILNAHKAGNYELSIPVLISQAEGILTEHLSLKGLFYQNRQAIKKLKKAFENCQYTQETLIQISSEKSLLFLYSSKRENINFNGFNRHSILHGESVDYGTKENSIKAFSFLNFVVQIVRRAKFE